MTSVPTRICDLGGWTDTWFAGHGRVCHLAVWPGIEAHLAPVPGPHGVEVHTDTTAGSWTWRPDRPPTLYPHPLLAATLDEATPPRDQRFLLRVTAGVPAGASMGTSASTCVAVLGAVDAALGRVTTLEVQARRAHRVETERLAWQSGVQDQFAAAPGAAHLVTVDGYPQAACRALTVDAATLDRLDATLLVIFLGRGHASSDVHAQVVTALVGSGPGDPRLEALRRLAAEGAVALEAGDLPAYGRCLRNNTDVQSRLNPSLVSAEARQVMALAREAGTLGWKINGAGGDGGTVTVLCAEPAQCATLTEAIATTVPGARRLPVRLARNAAVAGW